PFLGRYRSRTLPGQLDIRQTISPGACHCCAAVRFILLEEPETIRHMEFAGVSGVWLPSGCCPNPPLHRVQPKGLYTVRDWLSSLLLGRYAIGTISERHQAIHQAALRLFFRCTRSAILDFRCFADSAAILLALGARLYASSLAPAVLNRAAGDNSCCRSFCCDVLRQPPSSANTILGNADELHVCRGIEASAMARRSNYPWCCSSVDTARRPSSIRSVHLQQNKKSVRDSLLRTRGGGGLAFLETCCCW